LNCWIDFGSNQTVTNYSVQSEILNIHTALLNKFIINTKTGTKVISHQATTTPAALAAGSTSNHVQVGGTGVPRSGPHRGQCT